MEETEAKMRSLSSYLTLRSFLSSISGFDKAKFLSGNHTLYPLPQSKWSLQEMVGYTRCDVYLSILFFSHGKLLTFFFKGIRIDISSDIHPKLGYMSMYFQDFPLTVSQGSVWKAFFKNINIYM